MWKQNSIALIAVDAGRQLLRLCTIAVILASSNALKLTLNGMMVDYAPEN
jgi:hypothetical protein